MFVGLDGVFTTQAPSYFQRATVPPKRNPIRRGSSRKNLGYEENGKGKQPQQQDEFRLSRN